MAGGLSNPPHSCTIAARSASVTSRLRASDTWTAAASASSCLRVPIGADAAFRITGVDADSLQVRVFFARGTSPSVDTGDLLKFSDPDSRVFTVTHVQVWDTPAVQTQVIAAECEEPVGVFS